MAASPKFKIFNDRNEYLAACKRIEEAAVLVAFLGDGAEIRTDHSKKSTVWREGAETQSAAESYDFVSETVNARH